MLIRQINHNYDFKKDRATNGRYGIHYYPAMLHFKMVQDIIKEFSTACGLIYDPFCGSGVTLLESLKHNRNAYGIDLNPLALLITEVRTYNYKDTFAKTYKNLVDVWNCLDVDIPKIKNIDFWFKKQVINDLGRLRFFISNIDDYETKNLFLVSFSQTVRYCSNNRKNEFKRYRIAREKIDNFNPNVFDIFSNYLLNNINIIKNETIHTNNNIVILRHDITQPINIDNVDLIITSPPYGDSKTTVAYGQFSSFSFEWLNGLNPYGDDDLKFDGKCLGGNKIKKYIELPSTNLNSILLEIKKINEQRANEVYAFYYDLYKSIFNIIQTVKKNGTLCFVVGNRTVKNITIPMDCVVADFFQYLGLHIKRVYVRTISNKRMPLINSPSNIKGENAKTMSQEFVIVAKK